MAKRPQFQPWPENVWYTEGRAHGRSVLDRLRSHIPGGSAVLEARTFAPGDSDFGFDAAWQTSDGDRVKARLLVNQDRFSPDHLWWVLTATADRPWQAHWPSPTEVLFGDTPLLDVMSGQLTLGQATGFADWDAELVSRLFDHLSGLSWYILVVTHDHRPLEEVRSSQARSLAALVPPSLRGRLLELRVYGDQDQLVNEIGVLRKNRLKLKWGGALIVPPRPRPEQWPTADCVIRRPPGGDMEQLLKETADAVTRYASLQPHFCERVRHAVGDLSGSWELPETPLASERALAEMAQDRRRIKELEEDLTELRKVLESERSSARLVSASRDELQQQLDDLSRHPLSEQARQARAHAEEAWAAQEAAEALTEDLTAEVAWLRRRLAQQGTPYNEPAPERPPGPRDWKELFELAGELLPRINILDCAREPVKKLRQHSWEPRWLLRTWEALEALNAYAEAKNSPEGAHLAHFMAYLDWPQATAVISKALYVPNETMLKRGGSDVRRTRLFQVEELGEVSMVAHVRIGHGKPPAPRMYLYDDAPGVTGKIHVGYIGPHLPDWQGR